VSARTNGRPISTRRLRAGLVGALVAAGLLVTSLTACVGQTVRSTELWLASQPHVVSIGVPSSIVDELSYKATIRAELEPTATDADIRTLIDNSLAFIAARPGQNIALQFGINGVDFEVATQAEARLALVLWRSVIQTPHIVAGFVTDGAVSVSTLRTDAFGVFDALDAIHVQRYVAGYHAASDFDANSADFKPPLRLSEPVYCGGAPTLRALAAAAMNDTRVNFGTLDLCAGFNINFDHGYSIVDGVASIRATLDSAQLSYFPVSISVSPAGNGGSDLHSVSVTPGDAPALGVISALEGSGLPMRYELDAERALTLHSDTATVGQLFAALSASPVAGELGLITVTGSDGRISGTFRELPALVATN
jgi:hypothetical protein